MCLKLNLFPLSICDKKSGTVLKTSLFTSGKQLSLRKTRISYEHSVYESVNDKSLSYILSQKSTKNSVPPIKS